MDLKERLEALVAKKDTVLCVGLDPALPSQRAENVIPARYLEGRDENTARLAFCLDIIDQTKDFCCAYKPNQQYVAGFTSWDHRELTKKIRGAGAVSILDHKLSDIGDTLESALYHFGKWGYDAFTFNPYLGNVEVAVRLAHAQRPTIGVFVLVLTSNPEAVRYQKEGLLGGRPLYEGVAEDAQRYGADGCVVGATAHVREDEIRQVRAITGAETIFLVPGVGSQAGDPEKVLRAARGNLIINVGRDIIYAQDPAEVAERYRRFLNEARERSPLETRLEPGVSETMR